MTTSTGWENLQPGYVFFAPESSLGCPTNENSARVRLRLLRSPVKSNLPVLRLLLPDWRENFPDPEKVTKSG